MNRFLASLAIAALAAQWWSSWLPSRWPTHCGSAGVYQTRKPVLPKEDLTSIAQANRVWAW